MSLLKDDWQYPVVDGDLDPSDPLVNTATEYMYQMATVTYHVLHGTQTVVLDGPSRPRAARSSRLVSTSSMSTVATGPTSTGRIRSKRRLVSRRGPARRMV